MIKIVVIDYRYDTFSITIFGQRVSVRFTDSVCTIDSTPYEKRFETQMVLIDFCEMTFSTSLFWET